MQTFQEWCSELYRLTKARDLLCLISDNPEDHRESYEEGLTPDKEIEEQLYEEYTG